MGKSPSSRKGLKYYGSSDYPEINNIKKIYTKAPTGASFGL